jgi:hypothetical protein
MEGKAHAVVDDRKRNVLKSEDFLSVMVSDKSAIHLANTKLKRVPVVTALKLLLIAENVREGWGGAGGET